MAREFWDALFYFWQICHFAEDPGVSMRLADCRLKILSTIWKSAYVTLLHASLRSKMKILALQRRYACYQCLTYSHTTYEIRTIQLLLSVDCVLGLVYECCLLYSDRIGQIVLIVSELNVLYIFCDHCL